MKYKIDKERLWSSPDRKEWVMCAFSGPDENLSEQNTDCIELKVSNGVLNALGQVVYYQQGQVYDGAHFIIGEDGECVQHQLANKRTKGNHTADSIIIELINPGPLHQDVNGVWRTWWGDAVSNDWIRSNDDKVGWVCCESKQIHSLIELIAVLRRRYNIDKIKFLDADCMILDPHVEKIINNQQWQK